MGILCFQNMPISGLPISIEHQIEYFCHYFGTFALFVKKGDILLILHCSETIQCLTLLQIRDNFERNPHKDIDLPIRREALDQKLQVKPGTSLTPPSSY